QITCDTAFRGNLAQSIGIRAVRRADDQDNIDDPGEFPGGPLTVLRRVTNVFGVGSDNRGEPFLECFDDSSRIIDAECRLSNKSELFWVGNIEQRNLFR